MTLDYNKTSHETVLVGKKIMIAAPARDHDFVNDAVVSFANIVASVPPGNQCLIGIESNFIQVARNKLFARAYENDIDYFISMDSDVALLSSPEPIVPYLVKQSDKYGADMIGGIVVRDMFGKLVPDIIRANEQGRLVFWDSWPNEMACVDAVGGSFLFITKKLIKAFTKEKISKFGMPFDFRNMASEDFSFCGRVRELGFKIWVDPAIQLGHQKSVTWTKSTWDEKQQAAQAARLGGQNVETGQKTDFTARLTL